MRFPLCQIPILCLNISLYFTKSPRKILGNGPPGPISRVLIPTKAKWNGSLTKFFQRCIVNITNTIISKQLITPFLFILVYLNRESRAFPEGAKQSHVVRRAKTTHFATNRAGRLRPDQSAGRAIRRLRDDHPSGSGCAGGGTKNSPDPRRGYSAGGSPAGISPSLERRTKPARQGSDRPPGHPSDRLGTQCHPRCRFHQPAAGAADDLPPRRRADYQRFEDRLGAGRCGGNS